MKKIIVTFSCVVLCACNATRSTPISPEATPALSSQIEREAISFANVRPCQGETFKIGTYALTITPSRSGDSLNFAVNIRNIADFPTNWFRAVPPPLLMHAFKLVDSAGHLFSVSDLGTLDPVYIEDKVIKPKDSLSGVVTFNAAPNNYNFIVEQILGSGENTTIDTPILQCSTGMI